MCVFVATAANATTTPTFSPDGLTAHTIVKWGGQPLLAGDIPAALSVCILEYNAANTRWELLNPAIPTTAWINSLKITTGDQSTTSNLAGNITDLIYPVVINSVYTFQGIFKISCSSTGGVKFAVTTPAGVTLWLNILGSTTSNTAVSFQSITASATLIGTAYCQEAQNRTVIINGTFTVGATPGNIQFQFASGTNTQTSTIFQEGTFLRIQKVA